ncbi:MAG: hypothetical protein QNJ68_03375 [Microcoleaceae cyanobacterium MO_207.B10]|nr:hypothetical protein [Microcoleaceae cyanobacterium MO_207.B10]
MPQFVLEQNAGLPNLYFVISSLVGCVRQRRNAPELLYSMISGALHFVNAPYWTDTAKTVH